jgi:hypothetical protein
MAPFRWTRQQAANKLHLSKRHFQRLVRIYRKKGIPGLRLKSKQPKISPNKSLKWIEKAVTSMKKLTGLGNDSVFDLVNEQFRLEGNDQRITPSLAYRINSRNAIPETPIIPEKIKNFDWKRPNNLIQSDLNKFNGLSILAMEDDHTRYIWSDLIDDESTETVVEKMQEFVLYEYNNLLTDNGPQFSKKNTEFSKYKEKFVRRNHIHSSYYHPQTFGKISSYQGNLKDFLEYQAKDSKDPRIIRPLIRAFNLLHNNGRRNRITGNIPAEVYSGKKDRSWFSKVMRILKSPILRRATAY